MGRSWSKFALMLIAAVAGAMAAAQGCRWRPASAGASRQPAATLAGTQSLSAASAPAARNWENPAKGVRLGYPPDWRPRPSNDYELMLLPPRATDVKRRITLDVPDLPPHLPWMIQMGRIQRDYLQDLKAHHPGLKLDRAADVPVPQSTARLVQSSWRDGSTAYHDTALLMIHASAVYILDAQYDDPHGPLTRDAFDAIRSSLQWLK